jgi:SAM-dependent methyltransferase
MGSSLGHERLAVLVQEGKGAVYRVEQLEQPRALTGINPATWPAGSVHGKLCDVDMVQRALPAITDQYDAFCSWVAEACRPDTWMLDIGAGDGDDVYAARLRPHVLRLVGVDPDPGIAANPYLDERHRLTLEQYAANDPPPFDVAVAVYVAEHVGEPDRFLRDAHGCLRAGGNLFLLTPNLWHYFGLLARLSGALHAEDMLLRWARADKPELHHVDHFPVRYRLNSVKAICQHAEAAGFSRLEICHLDNPRVFETYFPDRLRRLPHGYSRTAYRLHWDSLLGTLLVKLVA